MNKTRKKMLKLFKNPVLFFKDALAKRISKRGEGQTKDSGAKTGTIIPNQKKKQFHEYFQEITRFTQYYDVNSMKLNGEHIWPYIRNHLWVHMNFVALGKISWRNINALNLQNGHRSQLPISYRKKIKVEYGAKEIEEIKEQQVDFLFLVGMNSTEQIEIDSQIYHRITDPLYEAALTMGTALKLEMVKTSSPTISKWHAYVHKTMLILPPLLQKIGYSECLTYDSRFFKVIKAYIPSLNLSSENQLESIVNYELYTREYYSELLKRLNPKVICLYGFHYNAPLISAADELGILTVDLQHGLQVGWNPLYNNYDELPPFGYQALPDIFAVWGKKEYDNILRTFKSHKHRPIYMGMPWLKKIKTFSLSFSKSLKEKLTTDKLRILLIMQNQTAIPQLFLDIIDQSGDNIMWIVRHHPKGERYTSKDFSKTKHVLIDDEIDKILFNQLFKYIDIAISEGSALATEASYFGVKNIITSPMGLENYGYEIEKGIFYYLKNQNEFQAILDEIRKTEQASSYSACEDVEPLDFLNELLRAAESKKKKTMDKNQPLDDMNAQDELELKIAQLNETMYKQAKSGDIENAVQTFYKLRLMLNQTQNLEAIYCSEQDRWIKEAKIFSRYIQNGVRFKTNKDNVVMVGDSLALPRPMEALRADFGINQTSTFMFNNMVQDGLEMRTWAQRYLTTEKLLDNWNLMVENIQNKHLVIHLGLNDSAERIFLEGQRLALDVYDDELKNSIVEFGKQYRKEIIKNQYDHAYVGYEKFKNNVHEIIRRACEEEAKSIIFVNIIAFPKSHEIDTPGSLALTAKYNSFFEEIKSSYPEINLIDLNGIVNHIGFEKCMLPDNMHLNPYGHQVLAKEIFYHLTQTKESNVYKIAIIGVGQLGSRHLQGLKKISVEAHIELVEPFEPMRKIAMERYNELPENEKIASVRFCNSINELSDELDLVIVATNSDVRAKVVKELIESKTVKNLVLEKVLFQDINDYDYFERAFEEKNIKAWVNHPRREFAFYDQFLSDIRKSKSISYHVQGARWGLASNGLHFLDHLLFLSGQANPTVSIEKTSLCDYVEESKRAGFYEIFGSLVGKIGKATFCLTCDKDIDVGSTITITILADDIRLMIDDYKGRVMYAFRENGWEWNILDEKIIYFQSELTGKLADLILRESTCRLPTYHEAALLHKPFITVVKDILESNLGKTFPNCPIS